VELNWPMTRKCLLKGNVAADFLLKGLRAGGEVGIPAGAPLFQVCRCDGGERAVTFVFPWVVVGS
jgi:hypothetical protein